MINYIFFYDSCQNRRGRPVSDPAKAQKSGVDLCEKKTKAGKTIYYKSDKQRQSEKEKKEKNREIRQKVGAGKRGRIAVNAKVAGGLLALRSGQVGEIPTDKIEVDPKRFQYKIVGEQTKTGEVGSLEGVKEFDQNLAGLLLVWKDPSNDKVYVVNGHNRLAFAKRSGVEHVAVRMINASSAKEARAIGALANIAEGKGTSVDAAKFFRDSGLKKPDILRNIPLRESYAIEGMNLASLDSQLFSMVVSGELKSSWGSIIGGSGLSPEQQLKMFEIVKRQEKKGRNITESLLCETAQYLLSVQKNQKQEYDPFTGEFYEVEEDNAFDRLEFQSYIARRLSKEKRIFGVVGKEKTAEFLERAGNVINVEDSAKIARDATENLGLFDALKNTVGGISDLLNQASSEIKKAKKSQKDQIRDKYFTKILEQLPIEAGVSKLSDKIEYIFFGECPKGQRGRPMSESGIKRASEQGIETCTKTTKDNRTLTYRSPGQKEKDKKVSSVKQEYRKGSLQKKHKTKSRGRFPEPVRKLIEKKLIELGLAFPKIQKIEATPEATKKELGVTTEAVEQAKQELQTKQEETRQEETKQEETKQEETKQEETKQEETKQEETNKSPNQERNMKLAKELLVMMDEQDKIDDQKFQYAFLYNKLPNRFSDVGKYLVSIKNMMERFKNSDDPKEISSVPELKSKYNAMFKVYEIWRDNKPYEVQEKTNEFENGRRKYVTKTVNAKDYYEKLYKDMGETDYISDFHLFSEKYLKNMKKELQELDGQKLGFARYDDAKKDAGFPDNLFEVPSILWGSSVKERMNKGGMRQILEKMASGEQVTKEMIALLGKDDKYYVNYDVGFKDGVPLSSSEIKEKEKKEKK